MKRTYLQYNNLVFNGAVTGGEFGDTSFKNSSEDSSNSHGRYLTNQCGESFVESRNISLEITFNLKEIDCSMRKFFRSYAVSEVKNTGKLWAVEDGELLWAKARLTNINQDDTEDIYYTLIVNIELYEGVWHKADPLLTFLVPYNTCDFLDVLGYREVNECCGCFLDTDKQCCTCEDITEDMALCHNKIIDKCRQDFQIVEDEKSGCTFFNDRIYGYKLTPLNSGKTTLSEIVYSKTDLNTYGTITLIGQMKDPIITVNDTIIQIKTGEVIDGRLTIKPNLECDFFGENCGCKEIKPSDIVLFKGEYGFIFKPINNKIIVDRNYSNKKLYVYIKTDNITY